MNTKFIKMVKDKKSILQISKRFNITRKMSYDKIYRLKREGKI